LERAGALEALAPPTTAKVEQLGNHRGHTHLRRCVHLSATPPPRRAPHSTGSGSSSEPPARPTTEGTR
jgi:hypothetical protein